MVVVQCLSHVTLWSADDKASVQLEIYVNKLTAGQLNSGEDRLDDILVLHLEGGKDLFVSRQLGVALSCRAQTIPTI